LSSISNNLINNAKDALLEVEAGREKSIDISVATEIDDAGQMGAGDSFWPWTGLLEKHLGEIFKPFFSTKPTSGTGLGLAIVKRLLQLYGEEIGIESKAGEGSLFTLALS